MLWADRVLLSSRLERRRSGFLRIVPEERLVTLPEPFSPPVDNVSQVANRSKQLQFGFLAEISRRKALAELVGGFVAWRQRRPDLDARLIIGGGIRARCEGYVTKIRRFAEKNGVSNDLIWLGVVRDDEKALFYNNLDLFIIPSWFESYGLTPLEALWFGKPILVTPDVGVLEYTCPDEAIIHLGERDELSFVNAFDQFVEKQVEITAAARRHARNSLFLNQGATWDEFFRSAINARTSAASVR
jgi:glycosyltransferase involved in cell wall biosynthesis